MERLGQQADGMFRWACLQLKVIRRLKVKTPERINDALDTLPKGLDETYERMLTDIDTNYAPYLYRALLWLAFPNRLLTTDEMAEPMSIDTLGCLLVRDEQRLPLDGVLEILSPLVVVLPPDHQIPFVSACDGEFTYLWDHLALIGGCSSFSSIQTKCRLRLALLSERIPGIGNNLLEYRKILFA